MKKYIVTVTFKNGEIKPEEFFSIELMRIYVNHINQYLKDCVASIEEKEIVTSGSDN